MTSELLIPGQVICPRRPEGMADDAEWFNPGMVRLADGDLAIAYRVNRWPSMLCSSRLDSDLNPIGPANLLMPAVNGVPEDPRLILLPSGNVGMILTLLIDLPNADQWWCVADRNLATCQKPTKLSHANAALTPLDGGGLAKIEKNWGPFIQDGKLYILYHLDPWTVCRVRWGQDCEDVYGGADKIDTFGLKWQFGDVRGGTPPVWHDGLWWAFFHSARTVGDKRIYYAGAVGFDRDFRPLYMTPKPIMAGPLDRFSHHWRNLSVSAVFPVGAVVRGDEWLVSYGFLDSEVRFAAFKHSDLKKATIAL
jgi:hypothetical protein